MGFSRSEWVRAAIGAAGATFIGWVLVVVYIVVGS